MCWILSAVTAAASEHTEKTYLDGTVGLVLLNECTGDI